MKTPRTDAAKFRIGDSNHFAVHVMHVEQLETELNEAHKEIDEAREQAAELLEALEAMADYYVQLVNTGDAGQWNPEEDDVVIKSRAAIAKAKGCQPLPNPLADAVQRMEAVPWKDIAGVWFALEDEKGRSRRQEVIEAIRTRLIQAVKGVQP